MPRREKWSLLAAILTSIGEEAERPGGGRISVVAQRANVPHERLMKHIRELEAARLLAPGADGFPRVTDLGREFVAHHHDWMRKLERFGLE
jgi:predicted transcriptional regulator